LTFSFQTGYLNESEVSTPLLPGTHEIGTQLTSSSYREAVERKLLKLGEPSYFRGIANSHGDETARNTT